MPMTDRFISALRRGTRPQHVNPTQPAKHRLFGSDPDEAKRNMVVIRLSSPIIHAQTEVRDFDVSQSTAVTHQFSMWVGLLSVMTAEVDGRLSDQRHKHLSMRLSTSDWTTAGLQQPSTRDRSEHRGASRYRNKSTRTHDTGLARITLAACWTANKGQVGDADL